MSVQERFVATDEDQESLRYWDPIFKGKSRDPGIQELLEIQKTRKSKVEFDDIISKCQQTVSQDYPERECGFSETRNSARS